MIKSFSKEKLKDFELIKTNVNLLETLEEKFPNDKDVVLDSISSCFNRYRQLYCL